MKSIDQIKQMNGPVYSLGQDSKHSCNEVAKTVERIKVLAYPVLGVEGKANYNEMTKQVEALKTLSAPFYDIGDTKYCFNEMDKAMESVKELNFPILMGAESAHNFNEIAKHAESLRTLWARFTFLRTLPTSSAWSHQRLKLPGKGRVNIFPNLFHQGRDWPCLPD